MLTSAIKEKLLVNLSSPLGQRASRMSMPDACRPLEDLRVSITGGVHFDLVKRVLRDINRSGQAPEEIIQQVGLCCALSQVTANTRLMVTPFCSA